MTLGVSKATLAIAISIAAMVMAIVGTALVARAGGGGAGTIVGYAYVKGSGNVVESRSLNVGDGDVSREGTGMCFDGLPFNFDGAQVTNDFRTSNAYSTASVVVGDYSCAGTVEAEVYSYNPYSQDEADPFHIVFYK